MKKQTALFNAKKQMRALNYGVLSTHSKAEQGFPFGSVSTFMSTFKGNVVFYISTLAQHTHNITLNPKICFTVFTHNPSEINTDPNSNARISLLGSAQRMTKQEQTSQQFFMQFPDSEKYQQTHDFSFYQLNTHKVRYIGGFGDIHWFDKTTWLNSNTTWHDDQEAIIHHVNSDHADVLHNIYQYQYQKSASRLALKRLTPEGFYIKSDAQDYHFIAFLEPVTSATQIREAFIALNQQALQSDK